MKTAADSSRVALVIPAYNEAATLREVAAAALEKHDWVIVVDDGSTDDTAQCVSGLPLTLLRLPHNRGKAQALRHGMEHALGLGADAVMTMDADGQHRAEDIPRLLEARQAHPDRLIIGSRLHDRSQFPLKRYLANRFANFWIAWAAGHPVSDSQSGFRIYPAALLNTYLESRRKAHGFVFESEIIIEAGRRGYATYDVPIPAIYAASARKSHFRPVLDILRITRMVARKLLQYGFMPLPMRRRHRHAGANPAQSFSHPRMPPAGPKYLKAVQKTGSDI